MSRSPRRWAGWGPKGRSASTSAGCSGWGGFAGLRESCHALAAAVDRGAYPCPRDHPARRAHRREGARGRAGREALDDRGQGRHRLRARKAAAAVQVGAHVRQTLCPSCMLLCFRLDTPPAWAANLDGDARGPGERAALGRRGGERHLAERRRDVGDEPAARASDRQGEAVAREAVERGGLGVVAACVRGQAWWAGSGKGAGSRIERGGGGAVQARRRWLPASRFRLSAERRGHAQQRRRQ